MRGFTLAALLLVGCGAAPNPGGDPANAAEQTVANSTTAGLELGWAYVSPDLRFDPRSSATRLSRPAFLVGAKVGYFADPIITRQYSASQLATMRADHAGFVAQDDLDGDGAAETYRTGFWATDQDGGTFLAVFEGGEQGDVIDTTVPGGQFLVKSRRGLVITSCNCPHDGSVSYVNGKLRIEAR